MVSPSGNPNPNPSSLNPKHRLQPLTLCLTLALVHQDVQLAVAYNIPQLFSSNLENWPKILLQVHVDLP